MNFSGIFCLPVCRIGEKTEPKGFQQTSLEQPGKSSFHLSFVAAQPDGKFHLFILKDNNHKCTIYI